MVQTSSDVPMDRVTAPTGDRSAADRSAEDRSAEDRSSGHRFATTIELNGTTATGFRVPTEVVEALGAGKKPRVLVTLGSHTYRSTVAVYGGVPMLPLSAANRTAAGVSAGEVVEVVLSLDTAERAVVVPDDLATAFADHPEARAAFDRLSYSKQRSLVLAIEEAKREDTRARRVHKIIADLGEARRR